MHNDRDFSGEDLHIRVPATNDSVAGTDSIVILDDIGEAQLPLSFSVQRRIEQERQLDMLKQEHALKAPLLTAMQEAGLLSEWEYASLLEQGPEEFALVTDRLKQEYEEIVTILPLSELRKKLDFYSKRISDAARTYAHNMEERDADTMEGIRSRMHIQKNMGCNNRLNGTPECRERLIALARAFKRVSDDVNRFECELIHRREYREFMRND